MSSQPIELVQRCLVVGYARTGQAVARVLVGRGCLVVAIDDRPSNGAVCEANRLGIDLITAPDRELLSALVADAELVVVSPGVSPSHPAVVLSPPERLISEIELAYRIATIPIVAITGTNGKTTVTGLVAAMLTASGKRARAVGNIGDPLVEAVANDGLDIAVAEVSSFQLAFTSTFRPSVATFLNFAEDHLDWHGDLAEYLAAKTRIWACQARDDIAIANADDPTVLAAASGAPGRLVTFGRNSGDYRIEGEEIVGPSGSIVSLEVLGRRLRHDELNAVAACVTAISAGADRSGCAIGLAGSAPLPHRISYVATVNGVDFFDDSKATAPSAVAAALASFSRVVLIAGGRSKGLDLRPMRDAAESEQCLVIGVVAIGESAGEVVKVFEGMTPAAVATSMDEAVSLAMNFASTGDSVLLSPGCASFDWYDSYGQRGDDFVRAVREIGKKRSSASQWQGQ